MRLPDQNGYSVGELFIALIIICALSFGGVKVAQNIQKADDEKSQASSQPDSKQASDEPVLWQFNDKQGEWFAQGGTPPDCPNPILGRSPVDLAQATGSLYPGQYRGFNYKPHGGFGMKTNAAVVRAPMDGKLTGLVRYIEAGEIQYKLSIQNDCGINYYFDHLYTLTDKFQKVAETTPEPRDDTRSLPLKTSVDVKAGEAIATVVGHPKTSNSGLDFGVLDYRARNGISQNTTWQALHQQYKASEWFGRCWLDMLPSAEAAKVQRLPLVNSNSVSDYCSQASKTTLDVNSGKPTNG